MRNNYRLRTARPRARFAAEDVKGEDGVRPGDLEVASGTLMSRRRETSDREGAKPRASALNAGRGLDGWDASS
jgi:hypothetical protein